jgi:Tfp pilus assembly protein PilF
VSARSSDFNYKVALASGLKSLQAGRLRQAEEQFRYLVMHFPSAEGGYRGLAKVLVEQEDRPAALRTLLDGGAALAKAGERAGAIGLYREATSLDPHDLTPHRRLAAALMLAGDESAAAQEFVRYIQAALESGAGERARLEAEFALARLPDSSEVGEVARSLGLAASARPVPRAEAAARPAPPSPQAPQRETAGADARAALMRSAFGGASAPQAPPPPRPSAPPPAPAAMPARPAFAANDPWSAAPALAVEPESAAPRVTDGEPLAADANTLAVEAAAARYLATRDPRGGEAALEAARRYIADGQTDAASDLLLQLISSGVADHDAQRLLVDVVKTLGKRDVAKAKCALLVQALRLDGRNDLAAEVEQLAQGE